MTGLTRLLLDIQPQEDLSPLSLPDGAYIIYWWFSGLGKRNGAVQSTCGDCHAVFYYRQRVLLFAESLYPRLAEGQSLDVAVSASRRVLLQVDNPLVQADALAPVLILASQRPLKTKEDKAPSTVSQISIDLDYYFPLPQSNFGFYGRRKEYRAIRDGLLYKNQRTIIVHGIGGIGKTTLISNAASRLKDHFKGIYAFDCRSGTLAPDTILLELREFLAIEMNYTMLPEKSRELLNRLAVFRIPVEWDAVHWVIGKAIDLSTLYTKLLQQVDRSEMPEEWQNIGEEELSQILKQYLPEKRQVNNW